MAKIEDYKIISYSSHHRVITEVASLIKDEYQPWGELIVVVSAANIPIFTQAMVKYNALWNNI